jgi:hypothetical protein
MSESDDIFNSIPISEDDVILNINFQIIFIANDSFGGFDQWMRDYLTDGFKGYNFKNTIRLNKIEFLSERAISFHVKLLNPEVAPQEIIEDLDKRLQHLLTSLSIIDIDDFWKDIASFTIGDEKETKREIAEYIHKTKIKR